MEKFTFPSTLFFMLYVEKALSLKKIILLSVLLLSWSLVFAQRSAPVHGVVKDKLGNPLAGVTVKVQGKANGTFTDSEGRFSLTGALSDSLEVSYIGYQKKTVAAQKNTDLIITLLANEGSLNEVVVVGYGAQKKESMVAAISTINAAQIVQSPTSN